MNKFEIPWQVVGYVGSAALSPNGEKVAAAFANPQGAFPDQTGIESAEISVWIWNVGTSAPIDSKHFLVKRTDVSPLVWESKVGTFVHYCDNGLGIMVTDPGGTISYLNPQTLEILHATTTNLDIDPSGRQELIACAANSPRAVVVTFGGLVGPDAHKKENDTVRIKVFDLSSGALLREWDFENSPPLGDAAISPSGEQIALSYVPMNSSGRPKAIPNLELFSVNTGKLTLQVKTAQLPGGISFIGESRIATADTILPGLFGQSKIKVWDTNNGKLVMELADPKLGARRRVGASSNGAVVLGYIPHERVTGGRAWNTTIEQRFRLWDATTGRTIATSPPLLPIQPYHFAPDLDISANGRAVIVFSPGPYPIDIFSISQSAPAQPH